MLGCLNLVIIELKLYFKMYFIPVIKSELSASLLQSSVSDDHSEI